MLYAILCYDSEETVSSWPKEVDEQVMNDLVEVQNGWAKAGKLGRWPVSSRPREP